MTNKTPSFIEENLLWEKGIQNIVGIDEVGRGAFAGPLVAAGVILPKDFTINGIKDSKLLTPKRRETLSEYIKSFAISFYIAQVSIDYINQFGVGRATQKAFLECATNIKQKAHFVLVDGFAIQDYDKNLQKAIIHGDSISVSIASASIIAKVYRDKLMDDIDKAYPLYNFKKNKGYGTQEHRDALLQYNMSPIHRTSFRIQKFTKFAS